MSDVFPECDHLSQLRTGRLSGRVCQQLCECRTSTHPSIPPFQAVGRVMPLIVSFNVYVR